MKVLAGLTLLDTEQGNTGMPIVAEHVDGHQRKAVLNFMAMMENAVHAKSYSNIFMTLAPTETINEVFEWVKQNKYLQKKRKSSSDFTKPFKKMTRFHCSKRWLLPSIWKASSSIAVSIIRYISTDKEN